MSSSSSDDSYAHVKSMIKAIRERIDVLKTISQTTWQEFAADASTEQDSLKRVVAENFAAIHLDINKMWKDIEMLHIAEISNTEKINQLYKFIFTLPELQKNKELSDKMMEAYNNLHDELNEPSRRRNDDEDESRKNAS